MKTTWTAIAVAVSLTVAPATLSAGAPLGTAFTYQGQLRESGVRFTGTADMGFSLVDAATDGTPTGSTVSLVAVAGTDLAFSGGDSALGLLANPEGVERFVGNTSPHGIGGRAQRNVWFGDGRGTLDHRV